MLKFNKHNVTDTETKEKARVWYSLDNRRDGRKCVTLYSKDFGSALPKMFDTAYINNTDFQSDYFEKGKVVLFEGHELYATARHRATA